MESARFFMPPWSQRSRVVVSNKSPDSFTYLDIGHTNPYTFFHKPFTAYALSGKMPEQTFYDSMHDMFGPFMDRRILLQYAAEAFTGTDEHGRKVEPWTVFGAFKPGGVASLERLAEAEGYDWVTGAGSDPSQVRGRDRTSEWLNNLTGTKISKVEITGPHGILRWKGGMGSGYNGQSGKHKAAFRAALRANVPIDVPTQIQKFKEMQADIFEEQKNLYSYIQAARRWGVDEKDIQRSMTKHAGVSLREYKGIRNGKFVPAKYSVELIKGERVDNRPIAYEELKKVIRDYWDADLSIEPDAQFPKK
jgi:hypothetical protein